jgi:hypothetical protein
MNSHCVCRLVCRTLAFSILANLFFAVPSLRAQQSTQFALKVLVPQKDAVVIVNQKVVDGTGNERRINLGAPPQGKDFHIVTAFREPNDYTKFTRTRKVPANPKGDNVVVDLTKAYDTEKIKVRYVPTPEDVVNKMCQLAKVTKKDTVFDLGCGDGRIVILAVDNFGAKRGVGIDIDPERIKESNANAKRLKLMARSASAWAMYSTLKIYRTPTL